MSTANIETLKKDGFSYEEIQDVLESEKEFTKSGVAYDLDEWFTKIRNNLFSKKKDECLK